MLKRLDIQGFKSFADKVQIEFNPGLTVIVGPNGSGKSNICDAINWALGEQRPSAFRGSRMEEVIFSGSDMRRGVGMGEVTVTLDNSTGLFPLDYSEVTITRRIFRSGESQFMINRVPCRLKDIHTILMDTGVGKGAYAIIGQGKVDEILHSRPQERRLIIEEAAGIVKYRYRKEEALRKLDNTEQDLLRLWDIISELSSRLGPLKVEAEKALLWRTYNNELRTLEAGLLIKEIKGQDQKLDELNIQLQSYKDLEMETINQEKISTLELLLKEQDIYLSQNIANIERINSERQLVDTHLALAKERQINLHQDHQRMLQKRKELDVRLLRLEQEKELETKRLQELRSSVAPRKKRLQDLQQSLLKLEEQQSDEELALEEDKSQIIELMNLAAQGRGKLQRSEERKAGAQRRLSQIRLAAQNATLEHTRTGEKIHRTTESLGKIKKLLSEDQQRLVDTENNRYELNQKLANVRDELRRVRDALSQAKSKHRVLVDTQEAYTSYQRGVREILLALKMGKRDLRGICGTVAELIHVPTELEMAVETALGNGLQYLVTYTDTDARRVIEYLKKNRLGRVTFLPLNNLKPPKRHHGEAQALEMPGVMGVAADLIEYNPKYQPVAELLLGKVLVVENADLALKVAKASGQRLRLVTLDGEYLHPGGSITGGSHSNANRGILRTRREKDEYAQRVSELEQIEKELVSSEGEVIKSLNIIEQNLSELRNVIVSHQVLIGSKEQELIKLEESLVQFSFQGEENTYEINNLLEEIRNQENLQVEVAGKVASAEEDLKYIQGINQDRQHKIKKIKAQIRSLEQEVTADKVFMGGIDQQQEGIVNLLKRLNREGQQCQDELKNLDCGIKEIKEKEAVINVEIDHLNTKLLDLKDNYFKLEKDVKSAKENRDNLAQELDNSRSEIRQAEEQVRKQQQEMHNLHIQLVKVETERSGLKERLEREYNITDLCVCQEVTNTRAARNRVSQLKLLLEEMGQVNPGAEEEYSQVLQRHDYLLSQKQDLDDSKLSLQKLISEMNSLMSIKFYSAFKDIDREFGLVFKELFGGGTATMALVGDDPLTAGIELEVQPPGKKLQNLGLLSGGERALTAIALLFAILRVSPSPFCVFDEIEAALDETNVDRFADFLLKFSSDMQFVVISHRKGTMERAETLYGVTMDNRGTSKLFTVHMARGEAAVARN